VLLVDDVLATGGTLAASQRLIERAGWQLVGTTVVLELEGLGGREKLAPRDVRSLMTL
jgi:adenine phosphoribosyltransferase